MTLSEAARRWVREYQSTDTVDTYLRYFDRLVAFLGKNDVEEFTEDNIRRFVAYLRENGRGAQTVLGTLSAFSAFAKWAMTEPHPRRRTAHLLEANPVDHIKRPKRVPTPDRWLTEEQLMLLLNAIDAAPANERLAISLVADQPLRASEWSKANVKQAVLDEDDDVALQVKVKGGQYKKKKLGKTVAEMLTASLRQREAKPDEPLLVNSQGRRWSRQAFSNMIARWAQRAGLEGRVRAHLIRHTIASMAAADGATVYEIADMLNHSSLATAQRYIHGVRGDAALDKIRGRLWK